MVNGGLTSEVGNPHVSTFKAYAGDIQHFQLRKPRNTGFPTFIFGGLLLNDAYSGFMLRRFSLPVPGSKITIDPVVTISQSEMISNYRYIKADALYIVHIPAPIGTGILLHAYCPELDNTTETVGVRWKPSLLQTIAFQAPYSSDFAVVDRTTGRPGQSGLSITIKTIEDNSTAAVNTPLQASVWCILYNVKCSGFIGVADPAIIIPGLNFKPIAAPIPPVEDELERHSEVTADGGEGIATSELNSDPAIPMIPELIAAAPTPKAPLPKKAKGKNSTGALNVKWIQFNNFTVSSSSTAWTTVTINPYTLTNKGESFNLPWKRNVWHSGSKHIGYLTSCVVQMICTRPPMCSGVVEVQDSLNNSSSTFIDLSDKVEFPVIPAVFSSVAVVRPRHYLTPWIRTNEAQISFRYRMAAWNRTADIADIKVSIQVRPGYSVFQTPVKPRRRAPSVFAYVAQEYEETLSIDELFRHSDEEDHLAPVAGDCQEFGEIDNDEGQDDDIDQDDFTIEIWKGILPVGTNVAIPLNLSVSQDVTSGEVETTINQKFERFAHITPQKGGSLGPVIGEYMVHTRLPTTVAGSIAHVAVPDDLSDEVALRIFGLSSIMNIAGSALTSIGGPLLGGFLNTAANLVGGALGLGGQPVDQTSAPTANPATISGEIPIARFVQMLKPIAQNLLQDPTFSTLLLQARDFVDGTGRAVTEIPVSVFARMNHVNVERSLFTRETVPLDNVIASVYVPKDRVPYILEEFGNNSATMVAGTFQNTCFTKFVKHLNLKKDSTTCINITEVMSQEITDVDVANIQAKIISRGKFFE